jgi:hypothetical protein|tara:strand:+ start:4097 stop:5413 length:1317 start_codon:yes stop_codon:yes gene_type:complete
MDTVGDIFEVILQLVFFSFVAMYIGIFIGIITDLKNDHKAFSDTGINGYKKRADFYNLIKTQSYLGFVVIICANVLTSVSNEDYLSSLSIVAVLIIFIVEFYMFFIYPGFDHMLCGLHTKDDSFKKNIELNEIDISSNDDNYNKLFDIENNSIGRPFYKTSRLKQSNDFKNKLNSIFSDIKKNRDIDNKLTVDDLLDDIKISLDLPTQQINDSNFNPQINKDNLKNIFKLTNYEIDELFSAYITSKTYYDDVNMVLNKNINYIDRQNILNDKKIIENIDTLTKQKPSDSFLIRNGIFGGSLFSVIGKLDFNYESMNSIKEADKNYLVYYTSISLFFSQIVVFGLAKLNLFSNIYQVIKDVTSDFDDDGVKASIRKDEIDKIKLGITKGLSQTELQKASKSFEQLNKQINGFIDTSFKERKNSNEAIANIIKIIRDRIK